MGKSIATDLNLPLIRIFLVFCFQIFCFIADNQRCFLEFLLYAHRAFCFRISSKDLFF